MPENLAAGFWWDAQIRLLCVPNVVQALPE
jgi:hypothetical protein